MKYIVIIKWQDGTHTFLTFKTKKDAKDSVKSYKKQQYHCKVWFIKF